MTDSGVLHLELILHLHSRICAVLPLALPPYYRYTDYFCSVRESLPILIYVNDTYASHSLALF